MADTLTITDNRTGKQYEVPITDGTIRATDLRQIKAAADDVGLATYDPAFMNTACCRSRITYIDGDKGILEYRGLSDRAARRAARRISRPHICIVFGELPTESQLDEWKRSITAHTMLHENIKKLMEGFQYDAHPMGVFLSTVGAFSTFYPDSKQIFDEPTRKKQIHRLIAKVPTIAAYAYRHSIGRPYNQPDNDLSYTGNFLNMLFRMTELKYKVESGARARARRALHPARGSRAELQHQRDARDRQLAGRSLLGDGGRRGGALRSAARRRQRGRAAHAQRDRKRRATSPASSSG